MEGLILAGALVITLINLGCWIYVLTKLFPEEGVGKGLFGVICGLYTFIWGWQNADRFNMKNVMIAWSICFVLSLGFNFLSYA